MSIIQPATDENAGKSSTTPSNESVDGGQKLEARDGPVSTTPPEILIQIFSHAVLSQPHAAQHPTAVAISHVNHLWREIALDLPVLWTAISTLHPRWTLALARRSRTRPIDIRAVHHAAPTARAPHLVLSEADMARVRVLALCPYALPLHLACQPMRALEELELHGTRSHSAGDGDGELMMFLNRGLFRGAFPRLRVLRLDFTALHPSSPLLRAPLTVLSLCDVPDLWETSRDMVDCLRRLPALEELAVVRCCPVLYEYAAHPAVACVRLPRLRALTLEEPAFRLVMALACLCPPPRCTVALHVTDVVERDLDGLRAALQTLVQPDAQGTTKPTAAFDLLSVAEAHTTVAFLATTAAPDAPLPLLALSLSLSLDNAERDRAQLFDAFFDRSVLPPAMRDVAALAVDLSLFAHRRAWRAYVRHWPRVEVVTVRCAAAAGIPRALRREVFDAFPRLRAVHVEREGGSEGDEWVEEDEEEEEEEEEEGEEEEDEEKAQGLVLEEWAECDLTSGMRALTIASGA
ncbi:hypothetical protein OF83DRAFT_90293 [Amylostereum chailletii]|nr:hypothetical protein OF83DRAFT_90293 [Amylostereum chailletii]